MALDVLLAHQDWVISRRQALAEGMSRRAIEYRLSKRHWQVLLPGVYLAAPVRADMGATADRRASIRRSRRGT